MKRLADWLCVGALVCSSCASPPERGDVLEANGSFYEALNVLFTGDAAPMIDVWSHADDTTYMGPMGGLETGWPAISKVWAQQAALQLGGAVAPENVHVVVGRDLAVVVDVEKGSNVDADGKALSVLVQLGLLDPRGLPVCGAEAARKVLDPTLPCIDHGERTA